MINFNFIMPVFCYADESHLSSANYQLEGQLDFTGQESSSENFSMFGITTDINDLTFWPEGSITTYTPVPIPEVQMSGTESLIQILKNAINSMRDFFDSVASNPISEKSNMPLAVASGAFVLSISALSYLMNLPWLSFWQNIWSRVIFLFGSTKKKKKWGIVYDTESNQPVPLAVVRIFDQEYKKLLETQLTDKDGRFGFLVQPGKYYINVIKSNYTFPSKVIEGEYHGEPFEIREDSVISVNVPIDPNIHKLAYRLNILSTIIKIINVIRIPVVILGTFLSISIYIALPDTTNLLIVLFYLIIWLSELYQIKKGRLIGMVTKKIDKAPIALAIIRIFDEKNNKLVATRVTESQGKYYYLTNPGVFYLTAAKENFSPYKVHNLKFTRGDVIDENIGLVESKRISPITSVS
jgi:hypothetical protein